MPDKHRTLVSPPWETENACEVRENIHNAYLKGWLYGGAVFFIIGFSSALIVVDAVTDVNIW